MKSSTFDIKPKLRKYHYRERTAVYYLATWRDPADLMQTVGEPLRYKHEYRGIGNTPEEALRDLTRVRLYKMRESYEDYARKARINRHEGMGIIVTEEPRRSFWQRLFG